jgi:hypothetical protein
MATAASFSPERFVIVLDNNFHAKTIRDRRYETGRMGSDL